MKKSTGKHYSLLLIFSLFSFCMIAQEYIVLNTFRVNVRTGPGTDFYIVCKADKGEIFELVSKKSDWVEIRMFSKDTRFVHKDVVYFLNEFVDGHNMRLPEDKMVVILQNGAQWAKTISNMEANEIIPESVSQERFENFRNICIDKNIHNLFEMHGIQTAMYSEIISHKEKN